MKTRAPLALRSNASGRADPRDPRRERGPRVRGHHDCKEAGDYGVDHAPAAALSREVPEVDHLPRCGA